MTVDVVIIGAGAAGIGAARQLAQRGLDLLVIEASDRVGGRAWTLNIDGMPLDLGCGWLHSADRNPWVAIAAEAGLTVDRREPAWGKQWRDLGFPPADRRDAERAADRWRNRLHDDPPPSDCAADALEPDGRWNAWLDAVSGFVNGAPLDRLSIADYLAYEDASSDENWRVIEGYGRLVAASLPSVPLRLATPAIAVRETLKGLAVDTAAGTIEARAAIVTVSTTVLASGRLSLPSACDAHCHAARQVPLGLADKLFLAIDDDGAFKPETGLIGDPHDARTATYYIRPLGRPVIEAFVGGTGAIGLEREGPAAAFDFARTQIGALAGTRAREALRPLVATAWARTDFVGGSYSHALPGQRDARKRLATPVGRIAFAGEATHPTDFSTAHGAYESGLRAADEVLAFLKEDAR